MPIWTSREPLQRLLQSVSGAMASVLFPGGCRLCEQLLTHALRLPICETSLASFSEIGPSICPLCGQPQGGEAGSPEATTVRLACQEQFYSLHLARSFGV